MSVAHVQGIFVGGALDRHDLKATEIHPEHYNGPVPAHLLEPMEEEPQGERVVIRPRLTDEERRQRSRESKRRRRSLARAMRLQKEPPNPYPCPSCGTRSQGKGSASGGGSWRQCLNPECRQNFRTAPPPPRQNLHPPCERCGGTTVANGKGKSGRQILKCKACGKSCRAGE